MLNLSLMYNLSFFSTKSSTERFCNGREEQVKVISKAHTMPYVC